MHGEPQPTTAELKAAFQACGLWRLGWTFDRALRWPLTAVTLGCAARAARRRTEQRCGRPAPAQPNLFDERPA